MAFGLTPSVSELLCACGLREGSASALQPMSLLRAKSRVGIYIFFSDGVSLQNSDCIGVDKFSDLIFKKRP